MKRIFLFILLIISSGIILGADYTRIDKQAASVPQNLHTVNEIARYLTRNLNSPTDKVRAIYYWIAHNIRYDVSRMYSTETYTDPQELVDKALKTRKGVCANYAALFQACCRSVGVQSYIIEGYTRQNGRIVGIGHAWNAVRIDGRFYNVDATWASGFLRGNSYINQFRDIYFMIPAVDFIKTHMPFDPIWQFLTNPITHKEFDTGDFSSLNKKSNFNYSDSIKAQSGLNTIDKLTRANQRIIQAGLTNALIRNQVARNQQEINTEKYNKATDTFNRGVEKFNYYIQCKNKQFDNLSMKDDDILDLLSTSRQLVESAEYTLSSLKADNNDLRQMSSSLGQSIRNVKKNLDTEDKFMGKYTKTGKPFRLSLFYR